jgi:hypothetical protein
MAWMVNVPVHASRRKRRITYLPRVDIADSVLLNAVERGVFPAQATAVAQ